MSDPNLDALFAAIFGPDPATTQRETILKNADVIASQALLNPDLGSTSDVIETLMTAAVLISVMLIKPDTSVERLHKMQTDMALLATGNVSQLLHSLFHNPTLREMLGAGQIKRREETLLVGKVLTKIFEHELPPMDHDRARDFDLLSETRCKQESDINKVAPDFKEPPKQ